MKRPHFKTILVIIFIFLINFSYTQESNYKILNKTSPIDYCYAVNYMIKCQIAKEMNINPNDLNEKKTFFYALMNEFENNNNLNFKKQSFQSTFRSLENKNILLLKNQTDQLTENFHNKVANEIKKILQNKEISKDSIKKQIVNIFIKLDKNKNFNYLDLTNNENSNVLFRKYNVKPSDFISFVSDSTQAYYERIPYFEDIDFSKKKTYINISIKDKKQLIENAIDSGYAIGVAIKIPVTQKYCYAVIIGDVINKKYNSYIVKIWQHQKPKNIKLNKKFIIENTKEISIYKYGAKFILDKIIK